MLCLLGYRWLITTLRAMTELASCTADAPGRLWRAATDKLRASRQGFAEDCDQVHEKTTSLPSDLQQVAALVQGTLLFFDPTPGRAQFNLGAVEDLKTLSSRGAKHNGVTQVAMAIFLFAHFTELHADLEASVIGEMELECVKGPSHGFSSASQTRSRRRAFSSEIPTNIEALSAACVTDQELRHDRRATI